MLDFNGSDKQTRLKELKSTGHQEVSSDMNQLLKKTQLKINSIENEMKNVATENIHRD